MTEDAKLAYSPLGKRLKKQVKTFEKQEGKQIDTIMNQKERQLA